MKITSRRAFILSGGSLLGLAACGNGVGGSGSAKIDARVEATKSYLISHYPGVKDLMNKAAGVLYMPLMTEAGFGFGGAYGRGALQVDGATVDYYSATKASVGLQIGAQQYGHALFFMTPDALANFRSSDGWAGSADMAYAVSNQGGSLGISTTTQQAPVIALVFGQAGLIAGATLAGVKYTRIIP